MAVIGLYDIDLWDRTKFYPNLELMKIYNYYYSKNNIVVMMKPKQDEGRFDQIFYFKDNVKTAIPPYLSLSGGKKKIYGYGFFNSFTPLKPEISSLPPSYTPYDAYTDRLKKYNYEKLKRSSYIRLENNDFSDLKENCKAIFIADHNPLYIKGIKDFIDNYKQNHMFYFVHSLEIKDIETFNQFSPYTDFFDRRLYINFKYNEDFFFENFNNKVIFNCQKKEETETNFQKRIVKMALWYKQNNVYFDFNLNSNNALTKEILKWAKIKNQNSFIDFCGGETKNSLDKVDSELRLLLKTKPKNLKRSSLDLSSNL